MGGGQTHRTGSPMAWDIWGVTWVPTPIAGKGGRDKSRGSGHIGEGAGHVGPGSRGPRCRVVSSPPPNSPLRDRDRRFPPRPGRPRWPRPLALYWPPIAPPPCRRVPPLTGGWRERACLIGPHASALALLLAGEAAAPTRKPRPLPCCRRWAGRHDVTAASLVAIGLRAGTPGRTGRGRRGGGGAT